MRNNLWIFGDSFSFGTGMNDWEEYYIQYLKPNDIVYVEANKKKVASTSMTPQWFAVILSGLSLMVISISTFVN